MTLDDSDVPESSEDEKEISTLVNSIETQNDAEVIAAVSSADHKRTPEPIAKSIQTLDAEPNANPSVIIPTRGGRNGEQSLCSGSNKETSHINSSQDCDESGDEGKKIIETYH